MPMSIYVFVFLYKVIQGVDKFLTKSGKMEAESLPVENLPIQDHVYDEYMYQNRIRQMNRNRPGVTDQLATPRATPSFAHEQPVSTGMFNGINSSLHVQPSDAHGSFSSYLSEPRYSGFQSQPSSSIGHGRSVDRHERLDFGSIPKQSPHNIDQGMHRNEGQHYSQPSLQESLLSSVNGNASMTGNNICHPSSYDHTATYGVPSQGGPQDKRHKVVFNGNSATLGQLNHQQTNQHVYYDHQINNYGLRMNVPIAGKPLSLQNGMTNQSINSIHGQPVSLDRPALFDRTALDIQTQYGNPLSLRNNLLNQHNGGTVNQSVSSIEELPVRTTSATPNMEARQSLREIPLLAHRNQQNNSTASQSIAMEVGQRTSLGQAEGPRLPQKINPMSLLNTRLNQENLINQGVPPQLSTESPSVVARHSLYRDQGDQESANTPPFVHEVLQGSPHVFRNQGDQGSSGNVPLRGHNQREVFSSSSHRNTPQLDNGKQKSKKVFILHFSDTVDSLETNPVLKLAVCLTRMEVDVSVDLFEYDDPPDSWPMWYERSIKDSNVVLCIITKKFYDQLTNGNHVVGYSVYNLMNSSSNIAFRAVFIDADKREMMEYIPPAIRGATCYSISSNRLTPNDDEFANLYAFLTGQNRVEKPPLGNRIVLAPKKSRCKSHNFKTTTLVIFSLFYFSWSFFWRACPYL